jgi:small conductance mechanosensitive channel
MDNWNIDIDWNKVLSFSVDILLNVLIAIAIMYVGFKLVKKLSYMMQRMLAKRNIDPSLAGFLRTLVVTLMRIMVVITALTNLGIEMTSFIALLGAAGLAIGMAFSGTLGNLAGGAMILIFKPFKAGDFISAQGEMGIVREVQIFQTVLTTVDNKTVYIPNGQLANGNMVNFTGQETRRIDLAPQVAYGTSVDTVKEILKALADANPKILRGDETPYIIGLLEMGNSSLTIAFRFWVKVEDYWPVYYEMNELVYRTFNEKGISIPFPQMDVHIKQMPKEAAKVV